MKASKNVEESMDSLTNCLIGGESNFYSVLTTDFSCCARLFLQLHIVHRDHNVWSQTLSTIFVVGVCFVQWCAKEEDEEIVSAQREIISNLPCPVL